MRLENPSLAKTEFDAGPGAKLPRDARLPESAHERSLWAAVSLFALAACDMVVQHHEGHSELALAATVLAGTPLLGDRCRAKPPTCPATSVAYSGLCKVVLWA